jgi:hypothetical protein
LKKSLHNKNFHRLLVWCNIGRDVENGLWAMYGARLGCYLTNLDSSFDYVNVRDFEWHTQYFENEVMPKFQGTTDYCAKSQYNWDKDKLLTASVDLGQQLKKKLNIDVAEFDETGSRFFKKVYWNPPRMGNLVTEKDSEGRIKYKTI